MRNTRRFVYFVMILFFPAFFLQLILVHGPTRKDSPNLLKTVSEECAKHFQDTTILKKLSRVLAKGDPDGFMTMIKKLMPSCQLQLTEFVSSNGYGLINPLLEDKLDNLTSNNFTNVNGSRMHIIKNETASTLSLCPRQSPNLHGHIEIDLVDHPQLRKFNGEYMNWPMTFEELSALYINLQVGGFYPGPRNCRCRGYNAIIIPYRDREEHLRYFLYYIHQLLQRQQLCYVVIVSEQADNKTFNKGQLMNTAFNYARDLLSFDCYIFHDVDVIAEDDRILYTCRDDKIMHIAPYIDKFGYKFVNGLTVGAAVGFTEEQFVAVNGYSNEYAGWGGEDDDMAARIRAKKIPVWRSDLPYSRFKMIKHGHDAGNNINEHRYARLRQSGGRLSFEGLSGLDTTVLDNILYKTHTRLQVQTYTTGLQRDLIKEGEKKAREKAEKQRQKEKQKQAKSKSIVTSPDPQHVSKTGR